MSDREHEDAAPLPEPNGGVLSPKYRALTIGMLLSVGMVAFESLGVATVLPVIARDLGGLGAYGWGISALMLANIVGTVLAGHAADRRGPARPLTVGMLVFLLGCLVAGAAGSWGLFLAGRALQGAGVGAVMAMAYTAIGLTYPEHLRARMFALLSSAWTIPSLVGPFAAGLLADSWGWRWVFVIMVPLVGLALTTTVPALRGLVPAAPADPHPDTAPPSAARMRWWRGPLASSLQLTIGTALLLHALLLRDYLLLAVLAGAGLTLAIPALRRVTPTGTLRAARGIGAGITIRALLSGAYFGAEAFLPLGLQELRGQSALSAGLGLSAGALTWVVGSFVQARWDADHRGQRARSVAIGSGILLLGTGSIAVTVGFEMLPAWLAVAGWAIGGLGMGIAFNASTTDTLEQAPGSLQGRVSSSLQLAQTLATGVIAGIGGAAVAYAGASLAALQGAILGIFALTAAFAVLSALLARRLDPR